jgi:hypothetical protein
MFAKHYMLNTTITIPDCENSHLVEWLRFIVEARDKRNTIFRRRYTFDFTGVSFLMPFHLVSLACLIEEDKGRIKFIISWHISNN